MANFWLFGSSAKEYLGAGNDFVDGYDTITEAKDYFQKMSGWSEEEMPLADDCWGEIWDIQASLTKGEPVVVASFRLCECDCYHWSDEDCPPDEPGESQEEEDDGWQG